RYNWGFAGVGGIDFDLTPGVWQYLTATLDTNYVLRLYLDGELAGSVAGPGPVVYDGTQFLRLSQWGGGGRFWNGAVDELSVWSASLTQEQIQEQMHRQLTGSESNLVAYLRFDEGAGATAADLTLNNHSGLLGDGVTNSQPAWVQSDAPLVVLTITNLNSGDL